MEPKIKTCNVQDIISLEASGDLDLDRIVEAVGEIAAVAETHPGHDILIDSRETELSATTMADLLEVAATADRFPVLREIKIASVVPDEAARAFIGERMKGVMLLHGFEYGVFTDLEPARKWLSS